MAVQLWPHRKQPAGDTTTGEGATGTGTNGTAGTAGKAAGRAIAWPRSRNTTQDTVVVDRRRWQRMRRHRHNPVSRLIWAAGWTAALILLTGMLLTWVDANQGNALVSKIMAMGTWLATPFHDLFRGSNPERRLYMNWGVAAAVYYVLGRVVSWLVRW